MPEPQTRVSLLLRLRDLQDAAAWQRFTETYAPLVYRYCRRQGLQEVDAADIAQEAFAQVMRSIRTFEYQPERGRFRDWFGAVVRSKVARFRKRQARDPAGGGEGSATLLDDLTAPEAEAEWTEEFQRHVLQVALARIQPDYDPQNWRAFEMAWLENRPAAEVAQALELAPSAVYVAKSRVLRRLREEVLLLAEDAAPLVPRGEA